MVTSTRNITLSKNIILKNVLYITQFKVNLISVNKLTTDSDLNVSFNKIKCNFSGKQVKESDCKNGLYILKSQFSGSAYTSGDFAYTRVRL